MSEPLVPADADLRDFPNAYVRIHSLTEGPLALNFADGSFRIGVILMLTSWHEVPAASLPNDDRALAAMAGVSMRKLRRLKDEVLVEFELCSDGRWYHRELSERANIAWKKKVALGRRIDRRTQMESGEWAATRSIVFKRDQFTCQYCGAKGVRLECDHVVPWSRGGESVEGNLVTSCLPCNRAKGAKLLSEWTRH